MVLCTFYNPKKDVGNGQSLKLAASCVVANTEASNTNTAQIKKRPLKHKLMLSIYVIIFDSTTIG